MKLLPVLYLCVFCLASLSSKAQFKMHGNIKDSVGNNLENVTVSINNSTTKAVIGYATTDFNGNYEISLANTTSVFIRISCIGYKTEEKVILQKVFEYNFHLNKGVFILPEVKVNAQNLLTKKGDTLNYDVKQFSRSQDRTIGDVIKNLPGITVSPSGTISYNGRPINKFYIDGDDLLGEKYAIASNTIPNDAVDAIQVLENHQPIKMLENRAFSDNAALNIKLKDISKLRLFGSGNSSIGIPFYTGETRINLLAFKPKIKFINTFTFNNIGSDVSSEIQTQNTNAPWQQPSNTKLSSLLGFTYLPDPVIPYRYFTNNTTYLSSFNCLIPVTKEESIRFNLYWLPNQLNTDTKATNTYYTLTDTIHQYENQSAQLRNSNLFFSTTYLRNSAKSFLQNQLSFEGRSDKGYSVTENEINSFNQHLSRELKKIQNTFSIKRITRNNLIIETSSNLNYFNYPENISIENGIYAWLLNNNINYKQTNQNAKQNYFSSNTDLSIAKQINKFTLSLKSEYFIERKEYTSSINLIGMNNISKNADSSFLNDFKWIQQRIALTPSLEYKTKRLNLSIILPVLSRSIGYDNSIAVQDSSFSKISFHPQLRLNYLSSKNSKISLTARRETDFTNPQDLLTGGILYNYRNLSQNNQHTEYTNVHSLSFSYTYRNYIKIRFFNTAILYTKNYSPTIPSQIFNLGLIENKQIYFNNLTNRLMFLSNMSSYLFRLKATLKGSYSGTLFNFYQVQNNSINNLQNTSHNIFISINAKPVWYFNSELSINYLTSLTKNISVQSNVGSRINLTTLTFQTTLNFTENFFIQSEANYYHQKNNENINKSLLVDARLNYTIPKTKTDIGIKAINIFNMKRFIITNIDGLQVSTNDYWLRPFTFLVSASFRF